MIYEITLGAIKQINIFSIIFFVKIPAGGIGQPGPQNPHFPCPEIWLPEESTAVEHLGPYWSTIHSVYVMPSMMKGKTQGTFGSAPPLVRHSEN